MQIRIGIGRQFVVHHRAKIGDIQPARRDITGDQHRATTIAEAHQHFVAIALFHIAVQCQSSEPVVLQRTDHFFSIAAHVAEHHARFRPVFEQQRRQQRRLA